MLTPMDIHNKTFSKGLRGYAAEEVDQFLQEVVNDYEKIYREHREMEEETDALRAKLKSYQTMETTMTSTLMMAQETAENVKVNARKEAELIIADAESQKTRMLREAADAVRESQEKCDRIVAEINVFRAKVRSLLESELALVDEMVPNREKMMAAMAAATAPIETAAAVETAEPEEPAAPAESATEAAAVEVEAAEATETEAAEPETAAPQTNTEEENQPVVDEA